MKRRTLDIIFSAGGAALAVVLLIVGAVMTSNANFSKHYVRDQLSREGITFKTADKLTPEERAYTEARSGCLLTYAGQDLTKGKQAECYANEFIGGHLQDPKKIPNADGMTYVQLGAVQADLRAQITEAEDSGASTTALQQRLDDVTTARDTVFKGEMLRGALLSAYGFSVFGTKASQFATLAFILAALLALLSIAGFVHAFVTPRTKDVHALEHTHSPVSGHLVTT